MNFNKTIKIISVLCCTLSLSLSAASLTGSKAPGFSLPDQAGKTHNLKDYQGKWVVMYFYPKDDTPGCTVEAKSFRDNKQKFDQLNTVILGVSVDSVESHKSFADDMKLNFTLLSDEQKTTSKAYGVLNNLVVLSYSSRQTFILDPLGMVAHHFDDVDPDTHTQETLEKLIEIQKIYEE